MCAIMSMFTDIMSCLGPKGCLSREGHLASAFWAGVMIPCYDAAAATVEAQPSGQAVERRCVVADDAAYDKWLHRMAVGTAHAHDMLPHEPRTFIVVAFIAALLTAVCLSLCHRYASASLLPFIASMTSVATSLAHPASIPTSIRIYSRSGRRVVSTSWYCPTV